MGGFVVVFSYLGHGISFAPWRAKRESLKE